MDYYNYFSHASVFNAMQAWLSFTG